MSAIKVRNLAMPSDAGTLSCLVRWNGEYAMLCVAHVLAPPLLGVDPSRQPVVECDVGESWEVGLLRNWDMPVSSRGIPYGASRDAAIAAVSLRTARMLADHQDFRPSGLRTAPPALQEAVHFTGASSGMTHATVVEDIDADVELGYYLYELGRSVATRSVYVPLSGLIRTKLPAAAIAGDSGSLLRDDADRAIGILVGMDRVHGHCYFSPLDPILREFDATLVPSGSAIGR